ncbi:MAG: hypothetical protein SGPRY_001731, partial [Prymnesium sp.]
MKRVFSAQHEAVRLIGRFVRQEGGEGLRFDWPASTIAFQLRGPTTHLALRMDLGSHLFDVCIDRERLPTDRSATDLADRRTTILEGQPGMKSHVIARDLGEGVHHVRLVKRTEANPLLGGDGSAGQPVLFESVELGDGGMLTQPSQPPSDRLIEFIGDSDTAALGNEARRGDSILDPSKQNAALSYAAVVADALGALHHNISYSAIGAVHNAPMSVLGLDGNMSSFYARSLATDSSSRFDSSQGTAPHIKVLSHAIIKLGGNDYYIVRKHKDEQRFVDEYVQKFAQ